MEIDLKSKVQNIRVAKLKFQPRVSVERQRMCDKENLKRFSWK